MTQSALALLGESTREQSRRVHKQQVSEPAVHSCTDGNHTKVTLLCYKLSYSQMNGVTWATGVAQQYGKAAHLWQSVPKIARCGHIWEEGEHQDGG